MDIGDIELARIRPLKRTEFDRLVEIGCFGPEERVELVRGLLLRMSPIGPPHATSVTRIATFFVRALGDRATVRVQSSFAALDDSQPQPDLVLHRGDSWTEHPSDAFLVVEVADSSLQFDRTTKLTLYAESNIAEYWIVNLVDGVIEVFDQPSKRRYGRSRVFRKSETVSPAAFPDVAVPVAHVVPD